MKDDGRMRWFGECEEEVMRERERLFYGYFYKVSIVDSLVKIVLYLSQNADFFYFLFGLSKGAG